MQTAVVWSCLLLIRSGQHHLARHSERGKKTRRTKEEVGRQHQGMDRPGVRQFPEGSGEQGKMEKTGYKIICDAPTTLAVKGLMIVMMMMMMIMMMMLMMMMMMMMMMMKLLPISNLEQNTNTGCGTRSTSLWVRRNFF